MCMINHWNMELNQCMYKLKGPLNSEEEYKKFLILECIVTGE